MVKRLTLAFDDDEFKEFKELKQSIDEDSPSWEDLFRRGIKCLEGDQMKIDYRVESVEVPEFLIEEYIEVLDDDKTKEEIEKGRFLDWVIEMKSDRSRKIVNKGLALLLIKEKTGTRSARGGYPIEEWMEFDVGKYRYHICAYGWTFECQDSKGRLDMIGYKEVIDNDK